MSDTPIILSEEDVDGFLRTFKYVQEGVHDTAISKGWWDEPVRGDAECIALMHSELSEALEGLRQGNPASDKLGVPFSQAEEEIADLIIRCVDWAESKKWRIAEAIIAKMKYNESRPHKHGKKF